MTQNSNTAYWAATEADQRWSAELHRVYGKQAGSARYDARGTATLMLKAMHDAKLKADCVLRQTWVRES